MHDEKGAINQSLSVIIKNRKLSVMIKNRSKRDTLVKIAQYRDPCSASDNKGAGNSEASAGRDRSLNACFHIILQDILKIVSSLHHVKSPTLRQFRAVTSGNVSRSNDHCRCNFFIGIISFSSL